MFKNKKYLFFLASINLLFFNFVFINNVYASVNNITQIVFTTVPQVPAPAAGELSKVITVKAQDSSGQNQLFDDADGLLELSTNSPTGNFFSNTSSVDSINTLSINNKGWSGRNFYYRDSFEGNFIITVKLSTVPDSGKNWSATQNISIGTTGTTTPDSDNNSNDNQSTPTSNSSGSYQSNQTVRVVTKTVYISTHSGEEGLSNYGEKTAFEITAGRERMALVGSPVEFDAKYSLLQNNQCAPSFRWSFGDGFDAIGKNIIHNYKYPGEYQVVLNGICGDYNSVSRTVIKVISPNISILSLSNGDIKIINNGKNEINIGNWKIKGGQKDFIFPTDTIISTGKKIILSKEDAKIDSSINKISLNNPSDGEVVSANINILYKNIATSSQTSSMDDSYISVFDAEKLLKEYKERLALNEQSFNKTEKTKEVHITNNADNLSDNEVVAQTALVLDSVNSSSSKNFWSKLIDIPVNSIKTFAHMFYNF
ncbi:MAG: PKD domain-containing protein [bacterium]